MRGRGHESGFLCLYLFHVQTEPKWVDTQGIPPQGTPPWVPDSTENSRNWKRMLVLSYLTTVQTVYSGVFGRRLPDTSRTPPPVHRCTGALDSVIKDYQFFLCPWSTGTFSRPTRLQSPPS